ncbi:hypothetical protein [Lysobacter sp. GCM10012299]|uniref:hypothetical protein n=1 Tax=Lysobacter sp. GCM10012299 TaxID=3317333 RepID=UPI00361EF2A4
MIENAQADVTRAYNNVTAPGISSAFNAGGAYGGTAHQAALAESQRQLASQLGDISTGMRSQDYDRQVGLAESDINRRMQASQDFQNRQLQALSLAPQTQQLGYMGANQLFGMGQQQQLLQQLGYDTQYGDFTEQRDWKGNQLGVLANALGTIQGGSTSQTGANPNYRSAGQNALSAAAAIGGMMLMASSKDIKDTQKPLLGDEALRAIRKMPVDRWNYKGDSTPHVGTYAEDFNSALGLPDQPYINAIDAIGVLTGAVKALDKKVNKGGK